MTTDGHRGPRIGTILLLLLLPFVIAGIWMWFSTISVSGSTTLPNGIPVAITAGMGGFSVSDNSESTKIETAGRTIEFRDSQIMVDGANVGTIDDSVQKIAVTVNRDGMTLATDGETIWSAE